VIFLLGPEFFRESHSEELEQAMVKWNNRGQTVLVVQDGPGKVFLFFAATRPTPLILEILQP
jgi:hypothetical protein